MHKKFGGILLVVATVAWTVLSSPESEKRFPPLQLPPGFKATLFACDPLIEYPSVIAVGPRPGTLLVAIDYMTGLGADIVRRDEIRLLEDTDRDGYADRSSVVADGFNSIQGLAWHNNAIYVMHAPYLSMLPDNGKGKRQDLFTGIGLPPEKDQIRLHNANGVVVGHDGWLYLAVGDRGVNGVRSEGDRLILESGGILRCRTDGRDLHVFASGLRNIYDVALDEELNVFIRDNENDGGDYKVRVCHSFFGADHGYPYLYDERPGEALPPLADVGLGSSAGGVAYLETQFPPEYHGNLFFCEWGRSVVRCRPEHQGSSFAPLKEITFASGAGNDPYGFKPTDVVVDRDGSLFVSDWADGQRPRRGRGRIYQIRHSIEGKALPVSRELPTRTEELVARLDSPSHWERIAAQEMIERRGKDGLAAVEQALRSKHLQARGKLHAVWIVAKLGGDAAIDRLFALARDDEDPRIQAQAIRALADLGDPVLTGHRLGDVAGDVKLAERLASLAAGRDRRVLLETTLALGRLRWHAAPAWLKKNVPADDAALAHAAQMTLRRCDNWPAVLQMLDASDPFRSIALRAAAEQFDLTLVDGLIERVQGESDALRQRDYAALLARVYKKPAAWEYWGFRPKARAANTVTWERTAAVANALEKVLVRADRIVRREILQHMLRERMPVESVALTRWLDSERDAETVTVLLDALADRPVSDTRASFENLLRNRQHSIDNRRKAAAHFVRGLDSAAEKLLLATAEQVEDGPVLADLLRTFGRLKVSNSAPWLLARAKSERPEVRAAVLDALGELKSPEAADLVLRLLQDRDDTVRASAALAAGKLSLDRATDDLLTLLRDADVEVRRSSLDALRRLREPRALPLAVAALQDSATALRALELVGELGSPEHRQSVAALARRQPSVETLTAVGKVLARWSNQTDLPSTTRRHLEQSFAEIHGSSGQILAWRVRGPAPLKTISETGAEDARLALVSGLDARIDLGPVKDSESAWRLDCELAVPDVLAVEFFTASTGLETVWLNDKVVFKRDRPGIIGPYPDRFEATLLKGNNSVRIQLANVSGKAQLQFRFRRKNATAEQERLALASLSRAGNPAHGREIFLNAAKSQCIKCHRLGDQGERIGPELTGLGARFPKVYIIESILQPSRTIAPSYETTALVLKNGTVLNGVKIADTDAAITIVDNTAKKHVIPRSAIEEQQRHPQSTMPDGLERTLSEDEFVDLISFLVNLKEAK